MRGPFPLERCSRAWLAAALRRKEMFPIYAVTSLGGQSEEVSRGARVRPGVQVLNTLSSPCTSGVSRKGEVFPPSQGHEPFRGSAFTLTKIGGG